MSCIHCNLNVISIFDLINSILSIMPGNKKISLEEIKSYFDSSEIEKYKELFPNNIGSFGYDPWGFNLKGIKGTLGVGKFMYEKFFRVEAFGLENIPKEGRVLIVPNHSGQLPLDGSLVGYAMMTNPYAPRLPKAMVERFFPTMPFVGNYLSSIGAVLGEPNNASSLLKKEEAVIVFPEGVRGSGKLFKDRYKLQRFGNGFMHIAMKHETPIIPAGIVGCEESIISFADIKPLAKFFGIPYFPLAIPFIFPTKVYIHFGKPLFFDKEVKNEFEIEARVKMVKGEIKKLINLGLSKRKSIF
ncbi:MAG: acyltransferase family protein [Chitinophagales bacterium]|nr:acyltransferase family protein [Chitinophagales bacterium]